MVLPKMRSIVFFYDRSFSFFFLIFRKKTNAEIFHVNLYFFCGCANLKNNEKSACKMWEFRALYSRQFSCNSLRKNAGADPGFFLGGGALVSCSTSTTINHIVVLFFLIQLVFCKNRRSSQTGVRTPCTLPLDPPLKCLCVRKVNCRPFSVHICILKVKRNIYANFGKAIAQTCVFIFYQVSHKKIRCVK